MGTLSSGVAPSPEFTGKRPPTAITINQAIARIKQERQDAKVSFVGVNMSFAEGPGLTFVK